VLELAPQEAANRAEASAKTAGPAEGRRASGPTGILDTAGGAFFMDWSFDEWLEDVCRIGKVWMSNKYHYRLRIAP
jgi:hypothetical protein